MTLGRPTAYDDTILAKTNEYIDNYEDHGHIIPSVAGLAVVLGVCKKTIYNWAEDPEKEDFLHALSRIATNQEFKLLNGGLSGGFNATITKLVLCNHGYSDKIESVNEEDSPPVEVHFHVKEAVSEIKTTNAKP